MDRFIKWFKRKMHGLVLFLEYPVEYIVDFGDDLKQKSGKEKIIKIVKFIATIYICTLTIQFIILFILLGAFIGNTYEYEDELWFTH